MMEWLSDIYYFMSEKHRRRVTLETPRWTESKQQLWARGWEGLLAAQSDRAAFTDEAERRRFPVHRQPGCGARSRSWRTLSERTRVSEEEEAQEELVEEASQEEVAAVAVMSRMQARRTVYGSKLRPWYPTASRMRGFVKRIGPSGMRERFSAGTQVPAGCFEMCLGLVLSVPDLVVFVVVWRSSLVTFFGV